jgi:hypothetical protein
MTKYIYIIGSGHSGSTLLDLILGTHSQIFSIGEIKQFEKYIRERKLCTCGKVVTECSFWSEVRSEILQKKRIDIFKEPEKFPLQFDSEKKSFFDRLRYFLVIAAAGNKTVYALVNLFTKREKQIVSNLLCIYDTARKIIRKNIIVDSSKNPLVMKWLWLNSPKEFKIIYLVRDGRGVLASNLRKNKKLKNAITEWANTHKLIGLLFRKISKEHYLKIKYESICQNPEREIKLICDFIGVRFEPQMLNYTSRVLHNIDGNRMRFSTSNEIKLDEKWKKDLDSYSLLVFDKLGKQVNLSIGYE